MKLFFFLQKFIDWASQRCDDAKYINTGSTTQIQQFFFGEHKDGACVNFGIDKFFKIDKDIEEYELEAAELLNQNPFVNHNAAQLKVELKERGIFRLFFSSYFVFFYHF